MVNDIIDSSFEWIFCKIVKCESEGSNCVITYSRNMAIESLHFFFFFYFNTPEKTIGQEIYKLEMQPAGSGYTLYHIVYMKSEMAGIVILAKGYFCTEEFVDTRNITTRQALQDA